MAEALISEKGAVDRCDAIALPLFMKHLKKLESGTAHTAAAVEQPSARRNFSETVWAPVCPMSMTLGRFKGPWGFLNDNATSL
jgi:hypothetical protein